MQSRKFFNFGAQFNVLVDSVFVDSNQYISGSTPPATNDFLLLDNSSFLLLDATNLLLLDP